MHLRAQRVMSARRGTWTGDTEPNGRRKDTLDRFLTCVSQGVLALALGQRYWSEVAYWMIAAGIITGLLAAPFGFIDRLAILPGTRAKLLVRSTAPARCSPYCCSR
jgi:hypothetical protein